MNELRHLTEFKTILKNYRVSGKSKETLAKTKIALMVAPSSTGRNTIIRELVKSGEYYFIVSDTTRRPRINDGVPEKNGEHYWFREEEDVLADLKSGKFLEAAVIHNQQVSGISIRELEKAYSQNKVAITDMEIVGVGNIMAAKPDTHAIFVLPPSFEEWQRRLSYRGKMAADEKLRRIQSAKEEFEAALSKPYYRFVINDEVEHAMRQIHSIIFSDTTQESDQVKGKKLAEKLLTKTEEALKSLK